LFDNLFVLTRTVLFSFLNADWQNAQQKNGTLGIAGEFFESLLGTNTTPFFIDDKGGWGRIQIQHLLNSHGIDMWGWGHSMGQYYFRVRRKQGALAQYLLLQHSVPLSGPLLQDSPIPGISAAMGHQNMRDYPTSGQESDPFNPITEINRLADKLGRG